VKTLRPAACLGAIAIMAAAGAVSAVTVQRPPKPQGEPIAPPGFAVETVAGGLRAPSAFVFAPHGRIFILERGSVDGAPSNQAAVRIVKRGRLQPEPALTLDVCGDAERGLLGIALDPDFAHNGRLFLYYTRRAAKGAACSFQELDGPRNRVSRFEMRGDRIDPKSERVLIDTIPSMTGLHNGGDLQFDRNGNLFISVGDNDLPASPAGATGSLLGKILRVRPDPGDSGEYSIPDDNPFAKAVGAHRCGREEPSTTPTQTSCAEVYAYGLRNPYRITLEPSSGELYAFDVGGNSWEEIDRIVAGGHYGYREFEGPCPRGVICSPPHQPTGLVDPIFAYHHVNHASGFDSCVVGGAFYGGGRYPREYKGDLFYGDFVRGWIRRLTLGADRKWIDRPFAANLGGLVDIGLGPDGSIYYVEYFDEKDNRLRRFVYKAKTKETPATHRGT